MPDRLRSFEADMPTYKIEQHIKVASSASLTLDGIERYFDKRGRILRLIVPLKDIGTPGTLSLERRVTVEIKSEPGLQVGDGRFEFRWAPAGETSPTFLGSLSVRSRGAQTELVLSGEYRPPFQRAARELGAVFNDETAQATGHLLLEELKAVLETEADAIVELKRSHREVFQTAGSLVGWKATHERFW